MSSHLLDNVYIKQYGTVCGREEHNGPLGKYFDKYYKDHYCHEKSFEKAERRMLRDALDICLDKMNLKSSDIDIYLGGDLMNQNTTVHYLARDLDQPFIGVYGACSSFVLSLSLAALLIEGGVVRNAMSLVSSHNATAERQYRYPVEYGVQKKNMSTFTATGGVATCLSKEKGDIRIEAITLGRVVDYQQMDPNDMGRAMAPAAYDTLNKHMQELNRCVDDYDLIVTGDLSHFGLKLLKEMLRQDHVDTININDCGCLLYDASKQNVYQGGSGVACSALVTMGYLYPLLKQKNIKHLLVIATGALLSPIMSAQKESVPAVAHAMSLEVVE
ncbi:MAG: stage V sporulation protein AD [Erysipelotrichaceae bacterium]|nr:stage V sporulation protein AD [Erysipelotrichaceae bacterium]